MGIDDIENAMHSYFECRALVRYTSFPSPFLFLGPSKFLFFFCQLVREETAMGRMVRQLDDNQCGLLIELEQYRSLGFDPTEVEELKHKVRLRLGSSRWLNKRPQSR